MRIGQKVRHRINEEEELALFIGIPCPSCGRRDGNHWPGCTWMMLQINLNMRAMIRESGGDTMACDRMIESLNQEFATEQRHKRRRNQRGASPVDDVTVEVLRTAEDFEAYGLRSRFVRFK